MGGYCPNEERKDRRRGMNVTGGQQGEPYSEAASRNTRIFTLRR